MGPGTMRHLGAVLQRMRHAEVLGGQNTPSGSVEVRVGGGQILSLRGDWVWQGCQHLVAGGFHPHCLVSFSKGSCTSCPPVCPVPQLLEGLSTK